MANHFPVPKIWGSYHLTQQHRRPWRFRLLRRHPKTGCMITQTDRRLFQETTARETVPWIYVWKYMEINDSTVLIIPKSLVQRFPETMLPSFPAWWLNKRPCPLVPILTERAEKSQEESHHFRFADDPLMKSHALLGSTVDHVDRWSKIVGVRNSYGNMWQIGRHLF